MRRIIEIRACKKCVGKEFAAIIPPANVNDDVTIFGASESECKSIFHEGRENLAMEAL